MPDFQSSNVRYSNFGLNVTFDPVTVPIGKYIILTNLISTYEGNLRARFGMTKGNVSAISGTPSIIGLRRLNNSVNGTATFVIRGSDGGLYQTSGANLTFTISSLASSFSANFGSIVTYRPSISATVWSYVYDTAKMVKFSGSTINPIGYPRPHSIHTTGSQDFAIAQGSASSGSLTANGTYAYRFSLFDPATGAESLYNLIPDGGILVDPSVTIDATHLNIDVKLPDLTLSVGSGGAQGGVTQARIYRLGGTISTWNLITAVAYTGSTVTYNDSASDASVQALMIEDENSDQPFTTTQTNGTDLAGTPLPYSTDPYLGYILAVGDPNNPGYMYWTNKFDPDRQDPDNRVEISSPQDPIQNIVTYNGRPMIFTKEGLYDLFIGLSSISTFTPSKTACRHGLFTPLAVCVGPEIYFMSNDGIYATSGGVERSLTDNEMRPFFQGTTVANYSAIDFSATSYMRMAFFKNELWYMYKGLDGFSHFLIFDVRYNRWRVANFRNGIASLYADEESLSNMWLGGGDGFLYQYSGTTDAGGSPATIPVEITTGYMTFGDPLISKEFNTLVFDVNPNGATVTVTVVMNNQQGTQVTKTGTSSSASRTKIYIDLTATRAEDIAVDVQWATSGTSPIIYGYELFWRTEQAQITSWRTTAVTHGLEGWQIVRSGYITIIGDGTVTLTMDIINDDGSLTTNAYTINANSSYWTKQFVPFLPTKGKIFNYTLTLGSATSFRFSPEQSEIHVKPWITTLGYTRANPFIGGASSQGSGNGQSGQANPTGSGGPGGGGGSDTSSLNSLLAGGVLNNPDFTASGFGTSTGVTLTVPSTVYGSPTQASPTVTEPGAGAGPTNNQVLPEL